ncbi:hypothetical protein [Porticoccus sp.]|uniref:hypothetical protein n=1 Tax=Porticoccus sp. TaxID=2024853 RepID=UPI003F6A1543
MQGFMKNASRRMFSIRFTVVGMFFIATLLTAVVAIGLQFVFSRHLATESVLSLYQQSAIATGQYLDADALMDVPLVKCADHAMYLAKAGGRDRAVLYSHNRDQSPVNDSEMPSPVMVSKESLDS